MDCFAALAMTKWTKQFFHVIIIYMKKTICSLIIIAAAALLFAERPIVRDIQARAGSGKKVRITWQLPENPEPVLYNLLLFRSTEQISSYKQLKGLEPIAQLSPDRAGYTDQLEDLRDYYYTVISQTESGPYDIVLLSFNSTVTGVHLTAKKTASEPAEKTEYETVYPEGKLRKTPLPFIDMIEGTSVEPLVSDKTAVSAMNSLSGNNGKYKKEKLTPFIFEEDLVSPDAGDDYLLYEILKNHFVQKNYSTTIEKLNQLIGTNISKDTQNRAYFYLGEAQYFSGKYEEAVRSFVKVEQYFPVVSKKWIEASLDRI